MFDKFKFATKLTGEDCKRINNKIQGEPDYYIRTGKDIFLFEFKDKLIEGEKKESRNSDEIIKMINTKFIEKDGIPQIVNNINRIVSGTFGYDKKIKSSNANIYPILVIGDSRFDVPGLNYWLNEIMMNNLAAYSIQSKNIKPLIIISIDTLILYRYDFNECIIKLKHVLKNYYQFLRLKYEPKDNIYPKNKLHDNLFQKFTSFSNFLTDKYRIKSTQFNSDFITKIIKERNERL